MVLYRCNQFTNPATSRKIWCNSKQSSVAAVNSSASEMCATQTHIMNETQIWCATQLAKSSFNHSIGRAHSWRFSLSYKNATTWLYWYAWHRTKRRHCARRFGRYVLYEWWIMNAAHSPMLLMRQVTATQFRPNHLPPGEATKHTKNVRHAWYNMTSNRHSVPSQWPHPPSCETTK